MNVVTFERVEKQFGTFVAVHDLSFSVAEGEIFGFLGGNGAGKTTSIRMLLDIIRPTSGKISVLGGSPGRSHARQIGFIPEERGLYARMTVLDAIAYFGALRGMSMNDAAKSAHDLIERFELGAWTNTAIQKLSKGMAQKVQLAAALVNSPSLMILDEPFSGLDPVNQGMLEAVVLERAASGSTVLFSTHVMQHAERMSNRLLLLSRGRKVFEGTQAEARATLPSRLSIVARSSPAALRGVAGATQVDSMPDGWSRWDVKLAQGSAPADLLEVCTGQAFPLRAFETRTPNLHDVFIHLVGADAEHAS